MRVAKVEIMCELSKEKEKNQLGSWTVGQLDS